MNAHYTLICSDWFDYETLLGIHNSYKHQRQFIIPVLLDVDRKEWENTRLGVFNYLIYSRDDGFKHKLFSSLIGSFAAVYYHHFNCIPVSLSG